MHPATQPTRAPTIPPLPYRVELHRYGPGAGVERLTKILHHGGSELLTPDEVAAWERMQWLEAENARLAGAAQEVEQYRRVVQDGRRLPDPTLAQDPAFAAFTLGKLETEVARLTAELERANAPREAQAEPDSEPAAAPPKAAKPKASK